MAQSSEVSTGRQATAEKYNNLRKDVLDPTLGHGHEGGADQGKQINASDVVSAFVAQSASAGDIVILDPVYENSTTSAYDTYVKLLECVCPVEGTIRIKWDMHRGTTNYAYSKVYRNGVAVGVEKSTSSGTYVAQSDDVSGWRAGDLVQIYGCTNGDECYCQNIKLCVA